MKATKLIVILLVSQCVYPSNNVYKTFIGKELNNKYNCISTLLLCPNGRVDEYDCEMDTHYFGHYWIERDTLFLETFCGNYCHEDSNCSAFGKRAFIIDRDSLRCVKLWSGEGAFGNEFVEHKLEHSFCWGLR